MIDIYNKSFVTLEKEITKDTRQQKHILYGLGLVELILGKWLYCKNKLTYLISIKIPVSYFIGLKKTTQISLCTNDQELIKQS